MEKLKLLTRRWVFLYPELLLISLVTIIVVVLSLPPWSAIIAPVLGLIIKPLTDSRRAKQEEFNKLAQSLDKLSTEFAKFTQGSWGCSIRSMSSEFVNKQHDNEKIKGWSEYFDLNWGMPSQLFENFRGFKERLRRYNQNPRGQNKLSALINEFLNLVALHYKLHENFIKMVEDIGDSKFKSRYDEFKKEYDEFHRNLRGLAPDLKTLGRELEGKFYYDFAKPFPNI